MFAKRRRIGDADQIRGSGPRSRALCPLAQIRNTRLVVGTAGVTTSADVAAESSVDEPRVRSAVVDDARVVLAHRAVDVARAFDRWLDAGALRLQVVGADVDAEVR